MRRGAHSPASPRPRAVVRCRAHPPSSCAAIRTIGPCAVNAQHAQSPGRGPCAAGAAARCGACSPVTGPRAVVRSRAVMRRRAHPPGGGPCAAVAAFASPAAVAVVACPAWRRRTGERLGPNRRQDARQCTWPKHRSLAWELRPTCKPRFHEINHLRIARISRDSKGLLADSGVKTSPPNTARFTCAPFAAWWFSPGAIAAWFSSGATGTTALVACAPFAAGLSSCATGARWQRGGNARGGSHVDNRRRVVLVRHLVLHLHHVFLQAVDETPRLGYCVKHRLFQDRLLAHR